MIVENSNEEYVKKYFTDPEEARLWLKLADLRDKYIEANRFKPNTPQFIKQMVNRAFSDLEKYRRNREKKNLNISTAKKIFQNHGLTATKFKKTDIRGFNYPSSKSYKISKDNPGNITFYGITLDTFNSIINTLKKGFKLKNIYPPEKTLIDGVSNIVINK